MIVMNPSKAYEDWLFEHVAFPIPHGACMLWLNVKSRKDPERNHFFDSGIYEAFTIFLLRDHREQDLLMFISFLAVEYLASYKCQ